MNPICDKFTFIIPYHAFEKIAKDEAEKIIKETTGIAYPCHRDYDAQLIFNDAIKNQEERYADAIREGKAQISGGTSFLDIDVNYITYNIPSKELYETEKPIYWLLRHIENIYHESRHINDMNSVFCKKDSEKAIFSSMLHLVSSNNPGFDRGTNGTNHDLANYSHNINEIRAEIYGFSHAKSYFKSHFPNLPEEYIDSLILDLINDKINETDGHYCLCFGRKNPIKSISDLPQLIKKSIDIAYKKPFVYSFNDINNLIRDPLARYMANSKYKSTIDIWLSEKDPFEQIRMLGTFTLSAIYKEYSIEAGRKQQQGYSNLKDIDLSEQNISNSCFRSHSHREEVLNNLEYLIGLQAYKKLPHDKNYNDDFNDFNYI